MISDKKDFGVACDRADPCCGHQKGEVDLRVRELRKTHRLVCHYVRVKLQAITRQYAVAVSRGQRRKILTVGLSRGVHTSGASMRASHDAGGRATAGRDRLVSVP